MLPAYFAKRNLKTEEVREGGFGWNFCKKFALIFTLGMFVLFIFGLVGGGVLGGALAIDALAEIWLFVLVVSVLMGFLMKKNAVVERGPTGALAHLSHR